MTETDYRLAAPRSEPVVCTCICDELCKHAMHIHHTGCPTQESTVPQVEAEGEIDFEQVKMDALNIVANYEPLDCSEDDWNAARAYLSHCATIEARDATIKALETDRAEVIAQREEATYQLSMARAERDALKAEVERIRQGDPNPHHDCFCPRSGHIATCVILANRPKEGDK